MKTLEVISKLKKEIPQLREFEFQKSPKEEISLYGTLEMNAKTFKDSGENEYLLGHNYIIFIAEMYKGQENSFFYLIIGRDALKRNFNRKRFRSIKWNELYTRGKTIDILIESLKKEFEKGYEFL